MNSDDMQLLLLLNSLSGPVSEGTGRGGGGGSRDAVSERPQQQASRAPTTTPALPGRRPSPGAWQGCGAPGPRPEPQQGEQQRGLVFRVPCAGWSGDSPASELICLQTPSPCQHQ